MSEAQNVSRAPHYRCDHPGCESRITEAYLVGLGGMPAFYCADHAPKAEAPKRHSVVDHEARVRDFITSLPRRPGEARALESLDILAETIAGFANVVANHEENEQRLEEQYGALRKDLADVRRGVHPDMTMRSFVQAHLDDADFRVKELQEQFDAWGEQLRGLVSAARENGEGVVSVDLLEQIASGPPSVSTPIQEASS